MSPHSGDADRRPASVYWALFVGLSTFSLSPILVRLAAEAPGLTVAVWRTVIAAAVLAPVALFRIRKEVAAFDRRDIFLILTAGILLALHFVTWIESVYRTTVASASVLVTTSPIFLAVLGYLFLREHLTLKISVSIVLAVIGAALIGLGDMSTAAGGAPAPLVGNSLALTASFLFSVYLLMGRVVRQKTSWLAYVFPLYSVTALTVLTIALIQGVPIFGFRPGFYMLCAAMALGPQVLGHGSFNYAIRYLPAAVLGLLSLVEPVGASILAYFLFQEVPSLVALAGMVIVLGAISVAIVNRKRPTVPASD